MDKCQGHFVTDTKLKCKQLGKLTCAKNSNLQKEKNALFFTVSLLDGWNQALDQNCSASRQETICY